MTGDSPGKTRWTDGPAGSDDIDTQKVDPVSDARTTAFERWLDPRDGTASFLAALRTVRARRTADQQGSLSRRPQGRWGRWNVVPWEDGDPGPRVGGMSRVFRVEDRLLHARLVLKELRERYCDDAVAVRSFVREARVMSALNHAAVLRAVDLDISTEGRPFLVMSEVEGHDLDQHLRTADERQRSLEYLLPLLATVAEAVHHAHKRGVVHRDLKPANLRLSDDGQVFILDWGIALTQAWGPDRFAEEVAAGAREARARGLTGEAIPGTPGYTAPEVLAGRPADPRTDVWGLGVILFELLTLTPAYPADVPELMDAASEYGPPEDPRARAPKRRIPEDLVSIWSRAMQRDPAARYPSAGAFAAALRDHLDGSARRRRAGHAARKAEDALREHRTGETELASIRGELRNRRIAGERRRPTAAEREGDLAFRRRVRSLREGSRRAWAEALAHGQGALAEDPGNEDIRGLIAEIHFEQFLAAERAGDPDRMEVAIAGLRGYAESGPLLEKINAPATLEFQTLRSAAATVRPVDRSTFPWSLTPRSRAARGPAFASNCRPARTSSASPGAAPRSRCPCC